MEAWNGKRILLCVTGGIAAYKSCELLRRLQDGGAEVRVAMTPTATEFVGPMTFAALSGFPVFKAGPHDSNTFRHIDYPRWADLVVVAPASAQSIARFANGMADEPVSQCVLASLVPKIIVPAMNFAMFQSPSVQRNLDTLRRDGFHVVAPASGRLACGEEGQGRFPDLAVILDQIRQVIGMEKNGKSGRNGKSVLITLGRTEEAIDPVRMITNRSSGKTGVEIAKAFISSGFQVTLVAGPLDVELPGNCEIIRIQSALEMHNAVLAQADQKDALVFCAAVADYRPKLVSAQKIKDSRSQLSIELEPNPNILRDCVARRKNANQVIVGFALETEQPMAHGFDKLRKSGADLLVLNTPVKVDSGFGKDSVEFTILEKDLEQDQQAPLSLEAKTALASRLVQSVSAKLGIA